MKKITILLFFCIIHTIMHCTDDTNTKHIEPQKTPYYIGLTPGKELKTPQEIIHEITAFFDNKLNNSLIPDQLYTQTKDVLILTAHILLHNAFFAQYICDKYLSDTSRDKIKFLEYIHEYQLWSRDPKRYATFKKEHEEISDENLNNQYHETLNFERRKMYESCQNCAEHKKILSQHIESLIATIMYDTNSCMHDAFAELKEKADQNLAERTKELNKAFANHDYLKILKMRRN